MFRESAPLVVPAGTDTPELFPTIVEMREEEGEEFGSSTLRELAGEMVLGGVDEPLKPETEVILLLPVDPDEEARGRGAVAPDTDPE